MAKKHMKKCSPSLAIKEMQSKTTLRFTPVRMPIIKKHQQQMLERMQGEKEPHTLLVGMQASSTTLENNMEDSLKTKHKSAI
jgi:hypothetical protein